MQIEVRNDDENKTYTNNQREMKRKFKEHRMQKKKNILNVKMKLARIEVQPKVTEKFNIMNTIRKAN